MRFTKMHGIGNDYIYVNCFAEEIDNPAELAVKLSNRHKGIGGDGLILIGPSQKADVLMRIFNADGSQAEMCGNGIRCVAKYVYERRLAKSGGPFSPPGQAAFPDSLKIETLNGVLTVGLQLGPGKMVCSVCVNMSEPKLKPSEIPVKLSGDKIIDKPISIDGQQLRVSCVSMGNPHAVFFCENVDKVELVKTGPLIEKLSIFPNGANVHFVQVVNRGEIRMRTWERGSGITLACGTGACACVAAAFLTKRCERAVLVHLPGGDLEINFSGIDNCIYMTGPAVEVFEGDWKEK